MTISAISILVTVAREEAVEDDENLRSNFVLVLCIQYLITFRKKFVPILALFDLSSEFNAIHLTFAKNLGLFIRPIDVGAQKIYSTTLNTFEIVVAVFSMANKANQIRFFEKTFLLANVSLEIVFEMLFPTLSSANVDFLDQKLWWRTYTTKKALSTTKFIKPIDKKEFAATMLDLEYETYVVPIRLVSSIALLGSSSLDIHPFYRPQIASLIVKKVLIKILTKYSDIADVFSSDLVSKLPKHTRINNHAIKVVNSQQPAHELIYSQGLVELETLKTYIEINLGNRFIKPSKSPSSTLILFNQKSDNFLWLCVD